MENSKPRRPLRETLDRHVERLSRRIASLERVSNRISWLRLGIVLGGGLLSWIAFVRYGNATGGLVMIAATVAFAVAAIVHARVDRSIRRHHVWRELKRAHVARMDLDWQHIPLPPSHPVEADHPFAADLNLIGRRSLLHLIDTAVSRGGSERLRGWLTATSPDISGVAQRQTTVRELTPMSSFRDRLALLGALATRETGTRWDGERLMQWLETHVHHARMGRLLVVLYLLAITNLTLVVLHIAGAVDTAWWALSLLAYIAIYLWNARLYSHLFEEAEELYTTLGRFRSVLIYLEDYPFQDRQHAARCCAVFRDPSRRPSKYLKKIMWLALAASSQRSEIVRLVTNLLMPWDLHFAHRLERYKQRISEVLPSWLEAWYDLEALNSLANYAYLNPESTFPDVEERSSGKSLFEARSVAHPLIPYDQRVANSFAIGSTGDITLITGSNMSGKSTFLRTLGVNLSMAFAGGAVVADDLRTVPFRLFTCLNVSDSVNDGISYFYAEVRRLKKLLVEYRKENGPPLFFLIDEIFRGTNNRERLAGSRAYVRSLVQGRGVGLIATHDLELVQLEQEVEGIRNMHFREEVVGDRMVFDYRLRKGPCPTTNALKIMEMEGLPVTEPTEAGGSV